MVGHEFGVDDCRFLHGDVFAGCVVCGVCVPCGVGVDTVGEEEMKYEQFLKSKNKRVDNQGIDIDVANVHRKLFAYQKDIVKWAVKKGRCAIFLDTGLGKTFIQLEFARLLEERTLIIAPLSVARQTAKEAKKIGLTIPYVRNSEGLNNLDNIYITNYEMIDNFDIGWFGTIILDESSILKSIGGVYKRKLIKACAQVKYRMACTATPAPNDNTEIGNHAEFLGICTHAEMLARFFINANKEHTISNGENFYIEKGSNKGGVEWRLKHHAEKSFYEWLSSWAICFTDPRELGYEYDYALPKLNIIKHIIPVESYEPANGELFFMGLKGLSDRVDVKRKTVEAKIETLKNILTDEQTIIWCNLEDEARIIRNSIDCVEIKGADSPEWKAEQFEAFQDGKIGKLLTKLRIGGFGMNFQNSHHMVYFGLNDSWEQFYQGIRREWRYGQKESVNVHIIITELEIEIFNNIMRKDAQARRLKQGLINHIKSFEIGELKMQETERQEKHERQEMKGKNFIAINGDSCEELPKLESNSVDLSVYSPPFVDLFTYTDSLHDLGNCTNRNEFYQHYAFIIRELLRVTKPGRLSCVHTSDIPAMLQRDGYIGIKDFPGDVIRLHEENGWIFHGRAFISKNPQAQAIRTKSKALLFVQLRKDSSDSRPALVDQILIFKKEGDGVPVCPVDNGEVDNETWIEWANGLWTGISEGDTLQFYSARAEGDEKHICPLQLETIERCIKLYSNPGETILTPFLGIGSEIFQAIKFRRKGIGIELKKSYFETAVQNLQMAEDEYSRDLFS
jgi:DNA modification methylase